MSDTALTYEDVLLKRNQLIRRQQEVQAALSGLKLGTRRLSSDELAKRTVLAAEFQQIASDIVALKSISASLAPTQGVAHGHADGGEVVPCHEAITSAKESFGLIMGYLDDVRNLLTEWESDPPASVAQCLTDLREVLGEVVPA